MVFLSREIDNMGETTVDLEHFPQKIFWSFSTKLYNRKIIKEACHCLKHKYDLNVNLIMFCCWAAIHDYPILTPDDFAFIANKVTPWNHGVVESLKKTYAQLLEQKTVPNISQLLEVMLENILFAEKTEQSLILQGLEELKKEQSKNENHSQVALRNIFNYISSQRVSVHKIDLEKVYSIITDCFLDSEGRA